MWLRIHLDTLEVIERKDMSEALQTAWFQGHVHGLQEYAWWKDGVQYVGTCGTTLKDAIADAKEKYAVEKEAKP